MKQYQAVTISFYILTFFFLCFSTLLFSAKTNIVKKTTISQNTTSVFTFQSKSLQNSVLFSIKCSGIDEYCSDLALLVSIMNVEDVLIASSGFSRLNGSFYKRKFVTNDDNIHKFAVSLENRHNSEVYVKINCLTHPTTSSNIITYIFIVFFILFRVNLSIYSILPSILFVYAYRNNFRVDTVASSIFLPIFIVFALLRFAKKCNLVILIAIASYYYLSLYRIRNAIPFTGRSSLGDFMFGCLLFYIWFLSSIPSVLSAFKVVVTISLMYSYLGSPYDSNSDIQFCFNYYSLILYLIYSEDNTVFDSVNFDAESLIYNHSIESEEQITLKKYQNLRKGVIMFFAPALCILIINFGYYYFGSPVSVNHRHLYDPSKTFTNKWYVEEFEFLNKSELCRLCSFPVKYINQNSSPRDLIVTVAFKHIYNALPWISSLRTTGCNATVVLFVDQQAYDRFTDDLKQVYQNCGASIINIGDFRGLTFEERLFLRYLTILQFLLKNRNQFDRIYHSDLYDTIFQADPFTTNFQSDRMYFIDEGFSIGSDYTNTVWINAIKGFQAKYIENQSVLCGGQTWGGVESYIGFIYSMMSIIDSYNLFVPYIDQAMINYIVHTRRILDFVSAYQIMEPKNGISTVGVKSKDFSFNESLGNIVHKDTNNLLQSIHQYDRVEGFITKVVLSCPKGSLNVTDYVRINRNEY